MATQVDFLTDYVVEVLKKNNLNLSEEQMNMYVPKFLSLLEQRIGLELLPKMDQEKADAFAELVDTPNATPEDWQHFWTMAVPNFEEEIKTILASFATDVERLLRA